MARSQDTTLFAGHPTRPDPKYHGAIDILCSHGCYRTIALLAEIPVRRREWVLWSGRPAREQPPEERRVRRLLVRQGDYPNRVGGHYDERGKLVEEDDFYRETRHAAENLRYLRAPQSGRPITPRPYPTFVELWGLVWEVAALPYRVQCSKCATVHTLPADALGSWDLQPACHSG